MLQDVPDAHLVVEISLGSSHDSLVVGSRNQVKQELTGDALPDFRCRVADLFFLPGEEEAGEPGTSAPVSRSKKVGGKSRRKKQTDEPGTSAPSGS